MAFVVKKTVNNNEYYYLNENKRIEGKVKTKTLAYLGKTKKDADKKAKEIIKKLSQQSTNKKSVSKEIIKKLSQQSADKKSTSKEIIKNMAEEKNKPVEKIETNQGKTPELVNEKISIDELANFCKRKGLVFKSSEIYGGFSGFWDFGPLGVELFNNLKAAWWKYFVQDKENMTGIEASVISHPRTWRASGHLSSFSDVAVVCKKCKKSTKVDKSELETAKCDNCGGEFENLGEFNLMFKTSVGALNPTEAYLRGETAQGMFLDFKSVSQTSRMQLPFGIAQIGRCFRNEIAPRDFLFRDREFHIGEFEFFLNPEEKKCDLLEKKHLDVKLRLLDAETQEAGKEDLKETTIGKMLSDKKMEEWHAYWLAEQILWFNSLGLEKIKIREHMKNELSHYSSATFDIDYEFPFGSKEVAGNANRGQYDLTQHQGESGESMEIFDEKYGKKVLPKVIEPTFGMDRIFLALLTNSYCVDKEKGSVVLKLPPKIAPIKAAIFPIVKNNEKIVNLSREVYESLKKEFNVTYDSGGSVGRRYSRNDEAGTPFCITIDEESTKNNDVTIRDRDTTKQIRVKISDVKNILRDLILGEIEFSKSGKKVV